MSDLSRKIVDISRVLASLLFLGVLATSMGSSADRLLGELLDEATLLSGNSAATATSLVALENPSQVPQNRDDMVPGEPSESHRTNGEIVSLILGQDKPPSRSRANAVEHAIYCGRSTVRATQPPLLTTSAAVSTSLGRQFTLVGARPSGTS